jgi:hypothetical protein
LHEKSVICDRTRRQDADSGVRALVDLQHDVGVSILGDLVGDEALPLEEPVGADHEPMVLALLFFAFF